MGLIYLFTGLYKLRGGVWLDGTALHYVLQLPAFLQPTGAWFFSVAPAWLLAFLTHYTLWIELAFVLFMFLPWGQPALRLAGLILATALQVGIGGLMSIFNFQAVMVIGTFVFLEPDWIVAVERGLRWTRDVSFVPFWSGAPRWFFLVLAGTRADEVTQTADWPDGDVWVKDGGREKCRHHRAPTPARTPFSQPPLALARSFLAGAHPIRPHRDRIPSRPRRYTPAGLFSPLAPLVDSGAAQPAGRQPQPGYGQRPVGKPARPAQTVGSAGDGAGAHHFARHGAYAALGYVRHRRATHLALGGRHGPVRRWGYAGPANWRTAPGRSSALVQGNRTALARVQRQRG